MVGAPTARPGAAVEAVIVGAGPAGDAVAAGLRDAGWDGGIKLIGAEKELPYERPHLSKGYLLGTVSRDKLPLRPAAQYAELGVELVLGESVIELGLDDHRVRTEGGRYVAWDRLCVATGSDSRRLPGLDGAVYLRNLQQADALRDVIASRSSLEILGAGFIGCEVEAVAVTKGCEVRVHEQLDQPLLRVLGPDLGSYLASVHRGHGVDLRLNSKSDTADLVAIGSVPRVMAGLDADHGIVVDRFGQTSAPGVLAACDVTRFFHPLFQTKIRVEHFQTSQRQGFAVGRTMAGSPTAYDEVPWFWSDQYELNLQYVGAGLAWDEVMIRGELGQPPFTVFQLNGGILVAVIGVNDHHTVARARHLMQGRVAVSRDRLADPRFDLRRALP